MSTQTDPSEPTGLAFRVSPYRFTDRPEAMREFLDAIGLRSVVSRDGFAIMHASDGMVGVHPLETAVSTTRVSTGFGLETDDARLAVERLREKGVDARWWDEAWGRQASIGGPYGEITVNEPMRDTHGYEAALQEAPSNVEVMQLLFTPDLDGWADFFARLGFSGSRHPVWRELRGEPGSGAIGLHLTNDPPDPVHASALAFAVAEPLTAFARRMRSLGCTVDDVSGAEAQHVEVIDPDGERIEIHHLDSRVG